MKRKWDISKSPSMQGIALCNKAVNEIDKVTSSVIVWTDKGGGEHFITIPRRLIIQLIKRVKAEYVRFLVDEVTLSMSEVKNDKKAM